MELNLPLLMMRLLEKYSLLKNVLRQIIIRSYWRLNECLGYSDLNFYFKLFLRFLKKINQWHYFLYYFNWLWVCTCICVLHEWWLVIFIGILSVNTVSIFFCSSILTSLTLQLHLYLTFLILLFFFFLLCVPFPVVSLGLNTSYWRILIQLCNIAVKLISKVLNFRY